MYDEIAKQGYAAEQAQNAIGSIGRAATMRERIDLAVKQAEAKLADTKRAKELFDKNPDLG